MHRIFPEITEATDLSTINVYICQRKQNGPVKKIGDPVFVPCADDYRYALHTLHETLMVPQAAHLSLKDRNSPQSMTAVGKTQSMLSSEDFKQPIVVTKERETHMVLWFGCSVDCEPVPSTEWGTGKCLKRKHEDTFIRLTEKQIHPLCFLKHISDPQISIERYFHTSGVRS